MAPEVYAAVANGCFSLLLLLLVLWQMSLTRRLRQELGALKEQGQQSSQRPAAQRFAADLARQEKSWPIGSQQGSRQTDKYRYIVALEKQGLSAAAIAEALQLSTREVEQLLKLARISRQDEG